MARGLTWCSNNFFLSCNASCCTDTGDCASVAKPGRRNKNLKKQRTIGFNTTPDYTRQYKGFQLYEKLVPPSDPAANQGKAGKPTQHTFLDNYLGNQHPRYAISAGVLRGIAKDWMKANAGLSAERFAEVLSDLIHGESSTEKWMAGILLDYSKKEQRKFDPVLFDEWLEHLEGWAEIDAVCTSKYTRTEIVGQWKKWKSLLINFSKSKNISKQRASIVFFCSPLSQIENKDLSETALLNVDRLKSEKSVLITKAISWLLRSMIKYNRSSVEEFLKEKGSALPKIALRETMVKLETGRKTKPKEKK